MLELITTNTVLETVSASVSKGTEPMNVGVQMK